MLARVPAAPPAGRPSAVPGDLLGELVLRHVGTALYADGLRLLVELLAGVLLGELVRVRAPLEVGELLGPPLDARLVRLDPGLLALDAVGGTVEFALGGVGGAPARCLLLALGG